MLLKNEIEKKLVIASDDEFLYIGDKLNKQELAKFNAKEYSKVVKFCKGITGKVAIKDYTTEGIIHLNEGEVVYIDSCMGVNDEYLNLKWRNVDLNEDSGKYSIYDVYTQKELL